MSLKKQLHDRLWRAYDCWHELREAGERKHEIKMAGLRDTVTWNILAPHVSWTEWESGLGLLIFHHEKRK